MSPVVPEAIPCHCCGEVHDLALVHMKLCKVCGQKVKQLKTMHIMEVHGLTQDEYELRYDRKSKQQAAAERMQLGFWELVATKWSRPVPQNATGSSR